MPFELGWVVLVDADTPTGQLPTSTGGGVKVIDGVDGSIGDAPNLPVARVMAWYARSHDHRSGR